MFSWIRTGFAALLFCALLVFTLPLSLQAQSAEQLEVGPPPLHRVDPPPAGATSEELEQRGDELRVEKDYLDSVDYYEAALKLTPGRAVLYNKIGMSELQMHRDKEARKNFERSIAADRNYANAYNNLGATYYDMHKLGAAIPQYEKAIVLDGSAAAYFSNLGSAYFGKKQFEKAIQCYAKAVELDPDIFDHSKRGGVQAKLASPEDRAHYDYVLAKMFARAGVNDRSLHYLKRAMEEGYSNIKNVYKDNEFSSLRKDPRFAELMAAKPVAISD
jgi:tetratricopeptide (TPR) repeat protein